MMYLSLCWLLPLLLAPPVPAGPAPAYQTYSNARFGYRVAYPPALVRPQPEADNGDGRRFVSADKQTTLTVFGSYNVLEKSVQQEMRTEQAAWRAQGATLTLSQQLSDGFVLSGYLGKAIFYQKTQLRHGTFATFIWQYPATQQPTMAAVVTHTARTFEPASGIKPVPVIEKN